MDINITQNITEYICIILSEYIPFICVHINLQWMASLSAFDALLVGAWWLQYGLMTAHEIWKYERGMLPDMTSMCLY